MGQRINLLANEAGTGQWKEWPGGCGLFSVDSATFGGGSVSLEYRLPGRNATPVGGDAILSAVGGCVFDLPGCEIRAVAATATAVYALAVKIEP